MHKRKRKYPADPILGKYIDHIYYKPPVPENEGFVRVMPDCMTEFVIALSGTTERDTGASNVEKTESSHFVGIKSRNHYLKLGSTLRKVGVRFKPGAMLSFTELNLDEVTNRVIDARDIFSGDVRILEEKIGESEDIDFILQAVEEFMAEKFRENKAASEFNDLIRYVYTNPVESKIDWLRKITGYDYKYLERLFMRFLGLHPKLFMRIVKFNYATKLLYENPGMSLTQVAYESGYYDQSHFTKSFKELSGINPKEYNPFSSIRVSGNQATTNSLFL